jgi:2,3-bisphosphoglycerate-independent phosphoglycerate mutase
MVNILGDWIAQKGLKQFRTAETEKFPHVTFFFNDYREEPFPGEERGMAQSPKEVATYDLKPEMSAAEVTAQAKAALLSVKYALVVVNYANPDMVGHTGVFSAAMKAAETVDACLSRIVPLALEKGYSCIIIADHGNSDYLINEDGTPNTAHTKNPVPCILVSSDLKGDEHLMKGRLADVAPTLLSLMGVPKGAEMTGESLLR